MLRRTLLSSLLQTALLGAAGGIGFAPGKAAARNNARPAPVEECEADLVIVGSGAAGLSASLAALEAGVRKVVILEKAAIAGGHTMLASGSVSAVFGLLPGPAKTIRPSLKRWRANPARHSNGLPNTVSIG